jgi:hypothetical protein
MLAVGVICVLLVLGCPTRQVEPLGGKWRIVWEKSFLPESGGVHPFLERKTLFGGRRVEENTWRYRYLGDDCVLYVAGNSNRGELMAECGDSAPVMVASQMDDYMQGYVGSRGMAGDPININGKLVSVREIKRRCGVQ